MKKIRWKMKVLEWSQRFSHYKSMGIFPNAQGQLTHRSFVGYCRIWNPPEILCVSLLPARMKKIQSKMKALEWSIHYPSIFKMLKGSLLHKRWWNLEEIQTYSSFHSCPSFLQEWRRLIQKWKHQSGHNRSPIISLWGFFQTLKGS